MTTCKLCSWYGYATDTIWQVTNLKEYNQIDGLAAHTTNVVKNTYCPIVHRKVYTCTECCQYQNDVTDLQKLIAGLLEERMILKQKTIRTDAPCGSGFIADEPLNIPYPGEDNDQAKNDIDSGHGNEQS